MENNGNEIPEKPKIIRAPTFRGKKDEHNRVFLKDRKVNALFNIEPHWRTRPIGICLEWYSSKHYSSLPEAINNVQWHKNAVIRKVDQGRFKPIYQDKTKEQYTRNYNTQHDDQQNFPETNTNIIPIENCKLEKRSTPRSPPWANSILETG